MGTKVYDNALDLITFSRASGGTIMDSDGLIKRAGHNLLSYSEQFENGAWSKQALRPFGGGSSSNAAVAPDGTTTADFICEDTTSNRHIIYQQPAFLGSELFTHSVWLKAAQRSWAYIAPQLGGTSDYAFINLSNGSLGTVDGDLTDVTVEDAGNGWYKIQVTAFRNQYFVVGISTGDGVANYTGDGISGIYIWGAHLYRSDMPLVPNRNQSWTVETTYYPTTTTTYEAPRIDHATDGTLKGLLVEEARTNLLTWSEAFDNAAWSKLNISVDPDTSNTSDPAGGNAADTLLAASGTNVSATMQPATLSGPTGSVVWSIYAKQGTHPYIQLTVTNDTAWYATFDLSDGSTGSSGSGTPSIEPIGDGWYRCSLAFTASSSNEMGSVWMVPSKTATRGQQLPSPNGTESIYIWGAQLEAGAFPTSYIPTAGATATRAADIASIPVSAFGYNQKAGSVVVESSSLAAVAGDFNGIVVLGASSSSRVNLGQSGPNGYQLISEGGVVSVLYNEGAAHNNDRYPANVQKKTGIAFNGSSAVAGLDGQIGTEDTSVVVPVATEMRVGYDFSLRYRNGHIKSIAYYPRRLSNAQLVQLTS